MQNNSVYIHRRQHKFYFYVGVLLVFAHITLSQVIYAYKFFVVVSETERRKKEGKMCRRVNRLCCETFPGLGSTVKEACMEVA